MTSYLIKTCLFEESDKGWVWITKDTNKDINADIESRDFIKIKKGENEPIICQARIIDYNFKNIYSRRTGHKLKDTESIIVMSDFYRKKLGIHKNKTYTDLNIYKSNCFLQKLWAFLHHPNDVVVIGAILSIISITLGIISAIFGILSFFR